MMYLSGRIARTFFILFVGVVVLAGCSRNSNLIEDNSSRYEIFVSEDASLPEKSAATILQQYLLKITGYSLPVTHEQQSGGSYVYVGFKGAPESLVENISPDEFGNEEYLIRSDGKQMLIAGGGPRGTLYGVIGYLSDHLGCRWYTKDIEKIPALSAIPLLKIEDRQKPDFQYREVNWREAYQPEWTLHNRLVPNGLPMPDSLGGHFLIYPHRGHTFDAIIPPGEYFGRNPEYFSEIDGKRTATKSQLCLTNPEVVRLTIEKVFEWIKENPKASVYSVSQNDNDNYCRCKHCKARDEEEGGPSGSLIHFINQVADSVAKVYPEAKLHTFAYSYSEVPPAKVRPAENVLIELCHYVYCSAHGVKECPDHSRFTERLERWFDISKNVTIWGYYVNFGNYLMPYPNFEMIRKDPKYYRDRGSYGLFSEGASSIGTKGGGEFAELRAWVLSQLMWNASRNADELIAEFVDNVYGKAAPHIMSYIALLHEPVKPTDVYFSIWTSPKDVNYLDPETIRKADSLFAVARKEAGGDAALLKRLDDTYVPVIFTKLYLKALGGNQYATDQEVPELMARLEKFAIEKDIRNLNAEEAIYGSIAGLKSKVLTKDLYWTDWHIIGPFPSDSARIGMSTIYPPEKGFDGTQSYAGAGNKSVKWEAYSATPTGFVDFAKLFEPNEHVVAYAYRELDLPEAREMQFGTGSNDGLKVWINGQLALDRPVLRSAEPDQDLIKVKMKKGKNTILVKVDQLKRGWGFYFKEKRK